jgi:hypothetical protein
VLDAEAPVADQLEQVVEGPGTARPPDGRMVVATESDRPSTSIADSR